VPFTEHTVRADGFNIRALEAGQGMPLLWFHGTNGLEQSRAAELLAEHHRVILLETPGFGASAVNERSSSIDDLARTFAAAARALGLERANVLGMLFGARIAVALAAQEPALVDRVVLAAPAIYRPPNGPRPPTTPEDRRRLLYAHPERQPELPLEPPELTAKHDRLVQRLLSTANQTQIEAAMASIDAPTLVVFGTHDPITPPELGRLYRERLPRSHLVFLYDAGHMVDAERPEAFAALVDDFLQRGDGFLVSRESGLIHP
jgi:pimeloyl-ACP methyl ester carboxylesterase